MRWLLQVWRWRDAVLAAGLAPGRYELVCNLPNHYADGMYAELQVTSS